jgi:hypothetical protein
MATTHGTAIAKEGPTKQRSLNYKKIRTPFELMRKTILYFLTGLTLATCMLSAEAQNSVATIPEGMITIPLAQGTTSYLSLPLSNNLTYAGVVSAVTSTSISVADSPSPWSVGELATPSSPYFVKFLTGSEAG